MNGKSKKRLRPRKREASQSQPMEVALALNRSAEMPTIDYAARRMLLKAQAQEILKRGRGSHDSVLAEKPGTS